MERFLSDAGFDRAPWIAVAFAGGIALWFALANPWQWIALIAALAGIAVIGGAFMRADGRFPYLRQALVAVPVLVMAGCCVVWTKSALVGAQPIGGPRVAQITATVLDREERPAQERVRLIVATRAPDDGRPIRVRLNVPARWDRAELSAGAVIRLRARLMPPATPMLPGGYDFARTAWFQGLAATGTALGPAEIISGPTGSAPLRSLQASLSRHVRDRLDGGAGALAATLASGDRGAIPPADDQAMRDSGLAHLLSISGLHVTALVGAAYLLALRLLALWPWLALRVRLPVAAAGIGALAGIGYTLLTGAEVPTVRSCIAALLVLIALALGRQPLSLRMVAIAALFVMLFWPEAVVGPSFQMSFSAVIAIVAVHNAEPVRAFMAPREESMAKRGARYFTMLLVTGVVIECALMPIGLYHFHRAGVYGSLANLIAIPLTTTITMPLIALALVLDIAHAGAPVWWLAGLSIDFLLWLAHWTASRPGAITAIPAFGAASIMPMVAGGLWLAIWKGRIRLAGLVPAAAGALLIAGADRPDVLVSSDGRHAGIVEGGTLYLLRAGSQSFAREALSEMAGFRGVPLAVDSLTGADGQPGAYCNRDFCAATLRRDARTWNILLSRGRDIVPERSLAAACERADIVISDRRLPSSCRPRRLKADRRMLERTGGLLVYLMADEVRATGGTQGRHGWERSHGAGGASRSPSRADATATIDRSR